MTIIKHPLGYAIRVGGLRIGINRDMPGPYRFDTGIFQNFGESAMDFRYIIFQIKYLGQIDFGWNV